MKCQGLLFMLALMLCCSACLSYAFTLPDTGQTKCYNSSGTGISCTGTGQDGEYTINPMSYTDNGDGTVTDSLTGLMWQKQDDGKTRTWSNASTYCTNLSLGGHSDWRLPSKRELITIVDYDIPYPGPTINGTSFPNTYESDYWSSTTGAAATYDAFYVAFNYGLVGGTNKSNGLYVRCVRGVQEAESFIDNGNGTVTDSGTGLMWQQTEGGQKTWTNALSYCEGLSLGGYTDWRLPNIKELVSITDDTRYSPAINTKFFPNVYSNAYWSSTTSYADTTSYATSYAFGVDFGYGYYSDNYKSYSTDYVRCLRGEQSGSSGSISHTLTAPSTITVSRGGTFGPIASSITNNTSSSYSIYLYAVVYTSKGSWVDSIELPMTLSAGQTVSKNDISRWIPPIADTGAYQFCEYLYDVNSKEIDHKCVSYTVQ